MTARELIRKATLAVSDLTSDGGLLNPEQASTFVRKLLAAPTFLRGIRRVIMNSPQMNINKIQFASRILRPGVSKVALLESDRSKPTTEQVQLNSQEYIAEVRIPYDVIEDNIERGGIGAHTDVSGTPAGGGLVDTFMTLIAERVMIDLEELSLNGDTGSGDPFLATLDGFLIQAASNVVSFGAAPIDKSLFREGLQAMPDQYQRNLTAKRHYLATDQEIAYRDSIGNRETTLGDAQIQGTAPVFGMGVPVEKVTRMPSAEGLFTDPQNLIWGIQRRVHMETDKIIQERCFVIVVTIRCDFLIEEEEAVVKYEDLGAP